MPKLPCFAPAGRPVTEVQSRIESLIDNGWIDRLTQPSLLDAFQDRTSVMYRARGLNLQRPIVFQAAPHDGCVFREFANQRVCANPASCGGSQRGPHREQLACDSNESLSAASVRSEKVDIKKSSVSVGMGMCHNPSTSGRSSHALVTHISQLMLCAPCLQPQSMLKENGKFHENGLFQLRVVMNKHTLEILSATAPSHALHPRILLSVQLLWFMQQCLTEYKRGLWQLQLCLSRRDPGNISSCNSQPTSQTQSRHCQAFLGYLDLVGHGVDSCGAGILPACR